MGWWVILLKRKILDGRFLLTKEGDHLIMDCHLIESRARTTLLHTLTGCHETRVRLYSTAFNLFVLVLLVVGIALTLYYCYKRKPSPWELRQKMLKDQDYILSKIRFYQAEQRNLMSTPIGIPGTNPMGF